MAAGVKVPRASDSAAAALSGSRTASSPPLARSSRRSLASRGLSLLGCGARRRRKACLLAACSLLWASLQSAASPWKGSGSAFLTAAGWRRPAELRGRCAVVRRSSREELKVAAFDCLDQDGNGRLTAAELRRFAEFSGFEGSSDDWLEEYKELCRLSGCRPPEGLPLDAFSALVDDEDMFFSDEELAGLVGESRDHQPSTPTASQPGPRGDTVTAGLDYFAAERRAGLYRLDWRFLPPWDPREGVSARSPRVGPVGTLAGCPVGATAQEAAMFVYDQVQTGIFGDYSETAEKSLSSLMALAENPGAGAGWFQFRLSESAVTVQQLSDLVLAPKGWPADLSRIPKGYMMHILTVGRGRMATMIGSENVHIVNALHRDVSPCRRLCDTCLCGVLGRKRVILFAPDEFQVDATFPRRPSVSSHNLRELSGLREDEAWVKLEELARRDEVCGGVVDLEPGQFVFVPHGWWHAVQPIDSFTFITGPSYLSSLKVSEDR